MHEGCLEKSIGRKIDRRWKHVESSVQEDHGSGKQGQKMCLISKNCDFPDFPLVSVEQEPGSE